MFKMITHSALALVAALAAPALAVLGPSFSLDDNPAKPLTSPPGIYPGYGAEDPFGLGTYGQLAPSPSLAAVPAMDADILKPDPAGGPAPKIDVPMSRMYNQPLGYLDALSDSKFVRFDPNNDQPPLHVGFSVDRISRGHTNTAVNRQYLLNQQPGDLFRSGSRFKHPSTYVGAPGPAFGYAGPLPSAGSGGGGNYMIYDESRLSLTAGNGVGNFKGPQIQCPPIAFGTHDNVDAATWHLFNPKGEEPVPSKRLFYSVAPDEWGLTGRYPATIYLVWPGNTAQFSSVYATSASMGLLGEGLEFVDDIDALVVWDRAELDGSARQADPGVDFALFSLSHGSTTLLQSGLSEADVFFTDFTGRFWLYARSSDLSLFWYGPNEGGDNVDALEVLLPGDANLDGVVNIEDFIILKQNYGGPGGWLQGDFNGDGVIDINDFIILKQYYGKTL